MDYKKQYFRTKYEKLKAEEPSNLISKGVVGTLRIVGLLLMLISSIGIIYSLARFVFWFMEENTIRTLVHNFFSNVDEQKVKKIIGLIISVDFEKKMVYELLVAILFLLLFASIIIRAFGNKITRRNNYIQELDRLAEDMLEENISEPEKKSDEVM